MRWWRRRSLRARLMCIGTAGLCLGFLLGGLALVAALGFVLQRSVDAEALRTARDVAALVDAGALPQPVPVTGSDQVQVIDERGRVLAASIDADRLVPMLRGDQLSRARTGEALFVDGDEFGLTGPVRAVAVPTRDGRTVLVARSMTDVLRGVHVLRTFLLVVFPLLVVALALVAWRTIGATLRPVEALRRGAESVQGTGRLPVPAGNDEIHRLAVTLNGMLDRLDAGRERQREFVADAAHELRSPLANMRTQLEVAQHLGVRAEWPAVGEDLLTDTKRLSRLVDDLLLLARSDAAGGLTRAEPVDVAALAVEVAARYPTVDTRGSDAPLPVPLSVTVPLPLPVPLSVTVSGEADGLRRVLANLLDNAVRHAESAVTLTVARDGGQALLTIVDDGPGIPAEDRERVFARFTRLDDARARDGGGAGLGLAIVRELVRRHGGTVALSSASVDGGLRVQVRLPLHEPAHR